MKEPTQIVTQAVEFDALRNHDGKTLRDLPLKRVRFTLSNGMRIEVLPNPRGGIDVRGVDGLPLIVEMNCANAFNVRIKDLE